MKAAYRHLIARRFNVKKSCQFDGTNDLIVSDVIRTNELQVWFLSEHLVATPLLHADAR
jgi:hypothetical protein